MLKKIALIVALVFVSTVLFWRMAQKKSALPKKTRDVITVGTNAEYPPFTFMQNDKIIGFDIDIARGVVSRLKKKIILKDMPFDALIPEAQLGTIHIIAAGITATKEREKNLLFTKPYISGDPLIIISMKNANQNIENIENLVGKKVVVNEGFVADFYMSKIEGVELIRLATLAEGFLALKAGRADAFVTAHNPAQQFFNQQSIDDFNIVNIEGTSDNYSLGVSKKYPELLEQVQKALDSMEADDTINTLKKKWKIK